MSAVMFPMFLPEDFFIDKLVRAIIAISLFEAAYVAEVIRGGLQALPRGQNVGKIAIAYTVWSNKKGGGKLIVKEVFKMIKKSNHLNRLVTLSPLTEMARKFHLNNGAQEIQVNEETQNFEYKL